MEPNASEIILQDGRFWRRTIVNQDLGTQDTLLAQLADQNGFFIKGLMNYGSHPVHVNASKGQLALSMEIPNVPFNTFWKIKPDTMTMTPVWSNTLGAIEIKDVYVPKDWGLGSTYFVVRLQDGGDGIYRPANCYLYQFNNGELGALCYSNVYSDGRLCMGDEWHNELGRRTTKSAIEEFAWCYNSFTSSSMNNHLITDQTYELFRRDMEGKWMKPDHKYTRYVRTCSVGFMQGFAP